MEGGAKLRVSLRETTEEEEEMERRAVLLDHRPPGKKASIAWLVVIQGSRH